MVPDNYDRFVIHESEQERIERYHRRLKREAEVEREEEYELSFVDVPNDYGMHDDELYGR